MVVNHMAILTQGPRVGRLRELCLENPFCELSDSAASSLALVNDPVVGFSNRDRAVMVALGVSLDDHSVNEHHVDDSFDGGFVTTADICRAAKCCSYFTIEFSVFFYRISE